MNNFWRYLLLAVVLFAGALVFIVVRNWDTVSLAWENAAAMTEGSEDARSITSPEGLTAYLSRHPGRVSLVTMSTDGIAQQAHNADARRPLYRFPHLLLLAAATERMHDGRLDSTEQVPLEDIGAFALPGLTDAAHAEMVDSLRAQGHVRGEAIPLGHVVRGMVTHQSTAAADWLMRRLGRQTVAGLPEAYGLTNSDAPRPMSGTYVTWLRARNASSDSLRIEPHLGMTSDTYADTVWAATNRIATDASFRTSVVSPLAEEGTGLSVTQQRDLANATFPAGTALDYARLLAQVYTGGPNARSTGTAPVQSGWMQMQALLETQLSHAPEGGGTQRQDASQPDSQALAASTRPDSLVSDSTRRNKILQPEAIADVAGAYPGLLTLGGYARNNGVGDRSDPGAYVVVLLMNDLPIAVFYQLAQTGIDKGLFLELAVDEETPERVVSQIRRDADGDPS